MRPEAAHLELPGPANDALLELARLLHIPPEEVLADAMDCLESAHGLALREHGRPMPRLKGGFSTWTNLERSLEGLERRQADLDLDFATHKRARKAKMRYAYHGVLWSALLKGLFAVLRADERLGRTVASAAASGRQRGASAVSRRQRGASGLD